jgi:acyl dehydratase
MNSGKNYKVVNYLRNKKHLNLERKGKKFSLADKKTSRSVNLSAKIPLPALKNSFLCSHQNQLDMGKTIINNYQEFESYLGKEIGVSEYIQITQEQINKFADATLDYQWIHTDPDRAAIESPFKSTIAHGYLTVSLLTYLWYSIVDVRNVKMIVNYGIEKLRFQQAVLVNDKIRARVSLNEIRNLRGIAKIQVKIVVDIEGQKKPAYDAFVTFLYHFND